LEKLDEETMLRWRKDETHRHPSLGGWVLSKGGKGSWTRRKVAEKEYEMVFYRGNLPRITIFSIFSMNILTIYSSLQQCA